ncbi:MAG: type VII secretion target [Microbacteriaceae bacterium]
MANLDYSVLIDDLTSDAEQWDKVAAVVGEAQTIAASLELEDFATDGISFGLGFQTQYNNAQEHIASYILAGQTTMTEIATKLRTTRDLYAEAEK